MGWKWDNKKIDSGKKTTDVAHVYGLNWFTVGTVLKDKAICVKCCSYVIKNNQQEMKENDGQKR